MPQQRVVSPAERYVIENRERLSREPLKHIPAEKVGGVLLLDNGVVSRTADGIAFLDEINRSAIGVVGNQVGAEGEAIQFFDDINLSLIGVLGNQTFSNGTGVAFSDRAGADPVIDDSLVIVGGNTISGPVFPAIDKPDFGIQFEGIDGQSRVIVRNNNVLESDNDGLLVQDFVSGVE